MKAYKRLFVAEFIEITTDWKLLEHPLRANWLINYGTSPTLEYYAAIQKNKAGP